MPEASATPEREGMFSPDAPLLQIAWDNTCLNALRKCKRYYQLSILSGYRKKFLAAPLYYGLMTHAGNERFAKLRANGEDHKTAVRNTVRFLLEKTGTYDEHGDWVPWEPTEPKEQKRRSRFSIIRTFVWYSEHYKNEKIETYILPDGRAAVELSFRIILPMVAPWGEDYFYCGHIDRVVRSQGLLYILEAKHTTYALDDDYFKKYSPDGQISGYNVGGNVILPEPVVGAIIDAAQIGVNFCRFKKGSAFRSRDQDEEWMRDTMALIGEAEKCAKEDYWPKDESACHHFGGCEFRNVCNKSPNVRQDILDADFKIEKWDPLKER